MRVSRLLAALVVMSALSSAEGQSTTASLRGHVRSARTNEPIVGATVLVVGSRIGAIADTGGRYMITGVALGRVLIRARFLGFADADTILTLAESELRTVDFRLVESITTLGAIRSEVKASEREVFEARPNVGITLLAGKVVSSVPRLGEADVLRAAQMLPGVMARNDFTAGLNVRGGEADQNQILIDGYPIFNPFHFGGLFGTFIDGAVEGLEIRTGGFPAYFGGRLSSVLDVKSTEETRRGLHGSGTISMLATSGALTSTFDEGKGSWMLAGRRTYADKVLKALGRDAIPYFFRDAQAHGVYRLSPKTTVSTTYYSGRDDLSALESSNPTAGGGGFTFFWGNRVAGITATHLLTDSLRLVQRASYSLFKTALDLGNGALRLENLIRESALSGSLEYRRGKHVPSIGYEVANDDMLYLASSSDADLELIHDEQHPWSASVYASDVWRPTQRLLVEGGLRYEWLRNSNWQAISPRLSGKFFVTPDFALSVAVGRYSQWLHSLAREDIPVRLFDFWTASDTAIAVSRATHYVVGGESWFGANRFIRLETYVKDYNQLVEPNPKQDPNAHGDEYNDLTGLSYGADLLIRQLEHGRWGGWLAYTYTFSTRTGTAGTFYPGQDRRNNVNLLVSYRPNAKYLISTRFGFASGTPYTDIIGQFTKREFDVATGRWDSERRAQTIMAVGGTRNASRLPSTQRLDLTVTRDFGRRVKFTPFLSVINAYNAKNVFMYIFDYTGTPATRKSYSQLPFVPTIGVSIEW